MANPLIYFGIERMPQALIDELVGDYDTTLRAMYEQNTGNLRLGTRHDDGSVEVVYPNGATYLVHVESRRCSCPGFYATGICPHVALAVFGDRPRQTSLF